MSRTRRGSRKTQKKKRVSRRLVRRSVQRGGQILGCPTTKSCASLKKAPIDAMLYMDNDDDATSDPITLQFVQQNKTLIENAFKQECSDGLITVKGEERIEKVASGSDLKGVRITIQNVANAQSFMTNAIDFDCFEKKMKLNPALKDIKVGIIWATGITPPSKSADRLIKLRTTTYTNPIKQNSNDSQPIYLRFETEPRRVPDPSIIREALIDQGFTGASVGVGKPKKGTVDRGATDAADDNVRLIEYTVSGIKAATKSSEALGGESDNRLDLEKLKKTLLLFNAMKGLLGSIVLATHVSNLVDAPLGAGSAAAVGVPTEASPYAMISGTPSAIAILLTPTQAKTKFYRDQLVNALEALARLEVVAITNRDGNERYDTMIGGGTLQKGGLQKGGQQQALEPYLFVFNGTIDYPKLYDAIALQTTPPLKGLQTVMPPRTQPLYAVPSSVYQEAQRAAADALASGLAVQPPTTGMPGTYPSSDNLSEPIGRPFPIPPGEAYRGVDDEDVFMPYTTETGLRGVDIMMRQGNEVTLYRILGRDDQQLKDGYDILRSQTIGIDGLGGVKMDTQSRIDKLKQDLIRLKSRLGDYSDAEIARQLPAAQPFFRQARTDILEQIAATEKLLLKLQGTLRTTAQGPQT